MSIHRLYETWWGRFIELFFSTGHKRHSAFKSLNPEANNIANCYATNFGGGGHNGTESQVISTVFKVLVSRCVQSFKELKCQENVALYSDVRQLITFIKNAHGGAFRRVVLSGAIDVTPKPHKKAYELQTTRVVRYVPYKHIWTHHLIEALRFQWFLVFST